MLVSSSWRMYVFGARRWSRLVVIVNHVIGTYTEYWAFLVRSDFLWLIVMFLPRGSVGSVWHPS